MKETMVSICIPTYNQAKYIADAIEGCINQKTRFLYEIIIRDDFSNDGTRQIISAYQEKYPELIKVIYEQENLYSRGVKIFPAFGSAIRGKYIALNEGDDYWQDPYKLEKQILFLENNPEYVLTVHGADVIDDSKKVVGEITPSRVERDYDTTDLILGGGEMIATNSMIFRSKYIYELPPFYYHAYVEDYPLIIFLSTKGKVHYFPDKMSVYRKNAQGSWSRNQNTGDIINKQVESCDRVILLLEDIHDNYGGNYNNAIAQKIKHFTENKYILKGELKQLKRFFPERYAQLNIVEKSIMYVKFHFPELYKLMKEKLKI